jgi:peptidoglycan/LPS O-acetylase OafA/YrhL
VIALPLSCESSSVTHVRALDGFRGTAVLLVISFHFGFLEFGWTGVQIFFVLSGFLITSILVRERDLPLGFYLARFYWRRALRIFPLYFAYLAAVVSIFAVCGHPSEFAREWQYLFTYTFNFLRASPNYANSMPLGHLWSLSVEEQFYLFWPMVIFLTPRRWLPSIVGLMIAVSPLTRALTAECLGRHARGDCRFVGQAVYSVTWAQLDAFAIGALIAIGGRKLRGSVIPLLLSGVALLAAGLLNIWFSKGRFTIDTSFGYPINMIRNGQHIWGYSLINLSAAALVLACLGENRIARAFQSRWLTYTGRISYGLYVYHIAVQIFVNSVFPARPRSVAGIAAFAMDLCLLFALAHASYFWFERRLIRLKDTRFVLDRSLHRAHGPAVLDAAT